MKQQLILIISFIFLLYNSCHTNAQSPTLWESYCAPTSVLPGSQTAYSANLASAFTDLIAIAGQGQLVGVTEYGAHNSAEYAQVLYYCRGVSSGITTATCQACVAGTQLQLAACTTGNEAIVWYEECTVHVANRVVRGVLQTLPSYLIWSTSTFTPTLDPTVDVAGLSRTLALNVMNLAAKDVVSRYGYGSQIISPGVLYYVMAQCSPDLYLSSKGPSLCSSCLQSNYRSVVLSQQATISPDFIGGLMPSCQMIFGFLSVPTETVLPPQSSMPTIIQPSIQITALAPTPGRGPATAPSVAAIPVLAPSAGATPKVSSPAATPTNPPSTGGSVLAPSAGATPTVSSPPATPTNAPSSGGPVLAPSAGGPVLAPSPRVTPTVSSPAATPTNAPQAGGPVLAPSARATPTVSSPDATPTNASSAGGPVLAPSTKATPTVSSPAATPTNAPSARGPVLAPSARATPTVSSPAATPTTAPSAGGPVTAPSIAATPNLTPSARATPKVASPAATPIDAPPVAAPAPTA